MKEPIRLVIDTNSLFMNFYNPEGNSAKIIELAENGKIILFYPDTVKEELFRVMKKELVIEDWLIIERIESLPINWIDHEIYRNFLDKTKVKHEPDKPIEAVALLLNCEILSADKHFANRANINKIIKIASD